MIPIRTYSLKTKIKSLTIKIINLLVAFLDITVPGRYIYNQIVSASMLRVKSVLYANTSLLISTPNPINNFRAETFATKEPETLDWINRMRPDSTLWDIGANVGLYSCYAAKHRGCKVFAFEPSVFNLELLARNIYINNLDDLVNIIPLPLCEKLEISKLNMTTTEWGGALSTFGEEYGHDGKQMSKVFAFSTIGISMVDAINLLNLPQPDYIKMDVDGIEHLILKGGLPVLKNIREILIEINDQFVEQSNVASILLKNAGFNMAEKRHADIYDAEDSAARHTYNQIWINDLVG